MRKKNKHICQILVITGISILFHAALSIGESEAGTFELALLPDFNIAAAGDWDCNFDTRQTVNNILEKDPELVIGLGDYVYKENTADCWLKVIEPLRDIFKIVVGNHETKSLIIFNQIINYLGVDYFGPNNQEYYYSFDLHNAHFLVMSDYTPLTSGEYSQVYKKGSKQHTFVENDLAQSAENPKINWIIVSHHNQKYASILNTTIDPANEWVDIYHSLFEKYNVDLVLQGHQHNYQRTFPIKYNVINPEYPLLADNSTKSYSDPDGPVFVTVGTAGAHLQKLNGKAPYITTQAVKFGFLNIDILKNGTALNGTFYSNDGTIDDRFTISK